jgi:hypothetical protein
VDAVLRLRDLLEELPDVDTEWQVEVNKAARSLQADRSAAVVATAHRVEANLAGAEGWRGWAAQDKALEEQEERQAHMQLVTATRATKLRVGSRVPSAMGDDGLDEDLMQEMLEKRGSVGLSGLRRGSNEDKKKHSISPIPSHNRRFSPSQKHKNMTVDAVRSELDSLRDPHGAPPSHPRLPTRNKTMGNHLTPPAGRPRNSARISSGSNHHSPRRAPTEKTFDRMRSNSLPGQQEEDEEPSLFNKAPQAARGGQPGKSGARNSRSTREQSRFNTT